MRLQRGPPKAAPAGPPQKPGGVRGFRLRRDRFGLFSALFGSSVLVGVIKVPGFSLRKCGNTGHGTAEEHAFGFLLNTPHVEEFTMDTLRSGGRGQYSGIPSPLEERHFYWISVKSIFRFDNRHDFRFIGTSDTMSDTTWYAVNTLWRRGRPTVATWRKISAMAEYRGVDIMLPSPHTRYIFLIRYIFTFRV